MIGPGEGNERSTSTGRRAATVGLHLDAPATKMAVTVTDPLEVPADHRETQVDRFGPAAMDEHHRLAFACPGGEAPSIGGPAHHPGAEDHQVEGVDQRRYHRGGEIDRRSGDHGEPVEGDAVITGSGEAEGGEPHQCRPRADPDRFGHGDEQQRRSGDLHHASPAQSAARKQ